MSPGSVFTKWRLLSLLAAGLVLAAVVIVGWSRHPATALRHLPRMSARLTPLRPQPLAPMYDPIAVPPPMPSVDAGMPIFRPDTTGRAHLPSSPPQSGAVAPPTERRTP